MRAPLACALAVAACGGSPAKLPQTAAAAAPVDPELAFLPPDATIVARVDLRAAREAFPVARDKMIEFMGMVGCPAALADGFDEVLWSLPSTSSGIYARVIGPFDRSAATSCARALAAATGKATVTEVPGGLKIEQADGVVEVEWIENGAMIRPSGMAKTSGPGPRQLDLMKQVDRNAELWMTLVPRSDSQWQASGVWVDVTSSEDGRIRLRVALGGMNDEDARNWFDRGIGGLVEAGREKGYQLDAAQMRQRLTVSRVGQYHVGESAWTFEELQGFFPQ